MIKRILRIIIGIPSSITAGILATLIWVFIETDESWVDSIGLYMWWLASGQWEKLPE